MAGVDIVFLGVAIRAAINFMLTRDQGWGAGKLQERRKPRKQQPDTSIYKVGRHLMQLWAVFRG